MALIAAGRVALRLHALADRPWEDARVGLASLPGVGPWTLAVLSGLTWGEPDTVITGDSGIPSLIASTLSGERRADDARMLELLEPYRPHRYRVLRLALAARTVGRRS
jgi:3-methyladenine DNA glycosylase/8-oxoguanine DNA glycosylase